MEVGQECTKGERSRRGSSWDKGSKIEACLVVPGSAKSPVWVERRRQELELRGITGPDHKGSGHCQDLREMGAIAHFAQEVDMT